MFPGMLNPKKMQGMLKQLGMKQDNIDADEVIIRTRDKNIIISSPSVTRINFQGNDMFQISGNVSEEAGGISKEDIKTVMNRTKAGEKEAREALEKADGDIAKAIIDLS